MSEFRLDRNAFRAGKLADQEKIDASYWATKTIDERIQASWYMTCKAYGFDPHHPPKLDRTVFRAEKRFH